MKTLTGCGLTGIPANRFATVDQVLCSDRIKQAGSDFEFAKMSCINGTCTECGVDRLLQKIRADNLQLFTENKTITWQRWMPPPGKTVPDIVHIKGSLEQGVQYFVSVLKTLPAHIFRSNWNHNVFEMLKRTLSPGELAQIFDFSMNFRNTRQDESTTSILGLYTDGNTRYN